MEKFSGKHVYITGGSSGIGLSAASLFFARDAHVTILGRNRDRLDRAGEKIEKCRRRPQQKLNTIGLDVSNDAEVVRVLEASVKEYGVPDILINCAGRARPGYFEDITFSRFDETMKINLYGIWNTLKVMVPYMKKRGSGHIVNVSSVAGFIGVFGYTDYSASKFAVFGLSGALACELKPHGIRVSVLCPPDTDTPGLEEENLGKPLETRAVSNSAGLMSADKVAATLYRGICRGKRFILPGVNVKLVFYLKRFVPWLITFVMDSTVRKVQLNKRCSSF